MNYIHKFLPSIIVIVFSFLVVSSVGAVTNSPSLGMAKTYAVLSSTYTNTSAGTVINGDVGFTTPPAVAPLGTHLNYGWLAPYAVAGTDQATALSSLTSEGCTFNFPGGAINLSTDTTHGPIGVYTPGVYCSTGAMDIGGPLSLNGNGTYVFRTGGALTSTVGAIVALNDGASACNIFWIPTGATTLAANTTFFGNIIDDAGITVGANSTIFGRLLAFAGTVTTDTNTITVPTCSSGVNGTIGGGIPSPVNGTIGGNVGGGGVNGTIDGTVGGFVSGTIGGIIDGTSGGGGGGSSSGSRSSGGGSVLGASTGGNSPGQVLGASTENVPGFPNTGYAPEIRYDFIQIFTQMVLAHI